jgi:GNAT superfamily N-acetyltransferase
VAGERPKTRLAVDDDYPTLAGVLARAFYDDPFMVFALPDEASRLDIARAMFVAQLDDVYAFTGVVQTTPDLAGAAIWTPPHAAELPAERTASIRRRMGELFGDRVPVISEALQAIMSHRPEGDHWYLDFLGTDPDRQRQGVASSVLAPALARCDADGVAATLWTTTEANLRFYSRRGFEVVADVQPPGAPRAWWMRRAPH